MKTTIHAVTTSIIGFAVFLVLVFLPAGTFDYWRGWTFIVVFALATMIPSSPGYVGTFDYFAVQGLTAFGASHVVALTFALLVHLLLWLPVTIVGALFLVAPTTRRAAASERAVTAERAA